MERSIRIKKHARCNKNDPFFFDKPLIAIPSVSFEFRINRVRSNDALCFLRPILLRYDVTITLLCPFSFFFSFFLSISTHVFYILSSKFYLPFEQGSLSNRRQSSSSKNNRCYEISETEREKKRCSSAFCVHCKSCDVMHTYVEASPYYPARLKYFSAVCEK